MKKLNHTKAILRLDEIANDQNIENDIELQKEFEEMQEIVNTFDKQLSENA